MKGVSNMKTIKLLTVGKQEGRNLFRVVLQDDTIENILFLEREVVSFRKNWLEVPMDTYNGLLEKGVNV